MVLLKQFYKNIWKWLRQLCYSSVTLLLYSQILGLYVYSSLYFTTVVQYSYLWLALLRSEGPKWKLYFFFPCHKHPVTKSTIVSSVGFYETMKWVQGEQGGSIFSSFCAPFGYSSLIVPLSSLCFYSWHTSFDSFSAVEPLYFILSLVF